MYKPNLKKNQLCYRNLLADDHINDTASPQIQYIPDSDHDGRTNAQRTDHPHVTQIRKNGVIERAQRKH